MLSLTFLVKQSKMLLPNQSMNRHTKTEGKPEVYIKLFIKHSAVEVQFHFLSEKLFCISTIYTLFCIVSNYLMEVQISSRQITKSLWALETHTITVLIQHRTRWQKGSSPATCMPFYWMLTWFFTLSLLLDLTMCIFLISLLLAFMSPYCWPCIHLELKGWCWLQQINMSSDHIGFD